MSFVIAVHVKEGIVLASDSRVTYSHTSKSGNQTTVKIGIHTTDTTNKIFLCPNNIGLMTCGEAAICSAPITGYIEAFIREKMTDSTDITKVPQMLIDYFNSTQEVPNTNFFVAGYRTVNHTSTQCLYVVNVKDKTVTIADTTAQGARWDGETQTLTKIIQNTYMKDPNGKEIPLGKTAFSWNLFTLQDAVDFAKYAVDITIKTIRYSNMPKTVGGPIDILAIKPDQAQWIRRKELHD